MPIAAVVGAVSGVSKLFGDQHPKDAGRKRDNARAYDLASSVAGDRNAFLFLKYRSGKFGTTTLPPIPGIPYGGGSVGGWASGGDADEDAYAKYKQLAQRYEVALSTNPEALPGQVVDPTNVDKAPDGTVLGTVRPASLGGPLLIVAAIGAILFLLRARPAEG